MFDICSCWTSVEKFVFTSGSDGKEQNLVFVLEAEVFELLFVYGAVTVKRKIVSIAYEFIIIIYKFQL